MYRSLTDQYRNERLELKKNQVKPFEDLENFDILKCSNELKFITSSIGQNILVLKKSIEQHKNDFSFHSDKTSLNHEHVINNQIGKIKLLIKNCVNKMKEIPSTNNPIFMNIRRKYEIDLKQLIENLKSEINKMEAIKSYNSEFEKKYNFQRHNSLNSLTSLISNESTMLLQESAVVEIDLMENIVAREKETTELINSLTEINEIMLDLSLLVNNQGEILDRIDINIGNAQENVSSGVQNLSVATKYQKKTGKKLWIILGVLLMIGSIIGLIIGIKTRNQNNK